MDNFVSGCKQLTTTAYTFFDKFSFGFTQVSMEEPNLGRPFTLNIGLL
jgi:hypothetical protein